MLISEGEKWINELRRKWIIFSFLEAALFSLSVSLLITVPAVHFFTASLWVSVPVFLCAFISITSITQFWKLSSFDVARYLNNHFPELEESTSLLLKPVETLSLLQKFQADKVVKTLGALPAPYDPLKKLRRVLFLLVAVIFVSVVIILVPKGNTDFFANNITTAPIPVKETVLPEIQSYSVRITPPSYTGNSSRKQKQFSIKAESGAIIQWEIETNAAINNFKFIFNDKEIILVKPANTDSTRWVYSRKIDKSAFYQISLNGKLSDLYQVEAIADQPVSIKITSPKILHSTIDIGQPANVRIGVNLTDDYSITETYIAATMASGKGEAVSFSEQKINFNSNASGKKQFLSEKFVDMKALGMKPGDELYFFVKAVDNHGQESRSDIYFVSIQDTSELMSLGGLASGVNLVPEYFRSQRQLIIDTEKLLKEKESISTEEFNTRSNNLGVDQKLLRLRYGKFLGEENETTIGDVHEDGDTHEDSPVFGDTKALEDQFTHHTDNSEDATFYEPELKARLKATLTEMWNSELRLRTYKPQDALPYEYKALRLLKDLQEKSRAYVAKTTVKTTPLKLEKRLSGELGKISGAVRKALFEKSDDKIIQLKTALAFLETIKSGNKITESDRQLLVNAEKNLIRAGAQNPGAYLPALKAIKKIRSENYVIRISDINTAENGLQKLIGNENLIPHANSVSPGSTLSQSYFNNLKKLTK